MMTSERAKATKDMCVCVYTWDLSFHKTQQQHHFRAFTVHHKNGFSQNQKGNIFSQNKAAG